MVLDLERNLDEWKGLAVYVDKTLCTWYHNALLKAKKQHLAKVGVGSAGDESDTARYKAGCRKIAFQSFRAGSIPAMLKCDTFFNDIDIDSERGKSEVVELAYAIGSGGLDESTPSSLRMGRIRECSKPCFSQVVLAPSLAGEVL